MLAGVPAKKQEGEILGVQLTLDGDGRLPVLKLGKHVLWVSDEMESAEIERFLAGLDTKQLDWLACHTEDATEGVAQALAAERRRRRL